MCKIYQRLLCVYGHLQRMSCTVPTRRIYHLDPEIAGGDAREVGQRFSGPRHASIDFTTATEMCFNRSS